ncbi:MAG: hypothetical protein Ct9H90mP27_3810 [Gammaproteobacteria bacterium]|nr:MAG: hypothetical protein Ct9H90mP27_3810 [Gammaproteobacteria bacterium]
MHSFSIRAYLGESQISEPLGRVQDEFSDLDIGSYPFLAEDRYGTMLVIRGTNLEDIQNAAERSKKLKFLEANLQKFWVSSKTLSRSRFYVSPTDYQANYLALRVVWTIFQGAEKGPQQRRVQLIF